MELGEKLKQARLEAGLSQRQLCGEEITRNMLSQIENGAARPSMDTLRYLAGQLRKPVSWFLEEDAVTSPNQNTMQQARLAFRAGDFRALSGALESYRGPDPVFDAEHQLLERLAVLSRAEAALQEGRNRLAEELLTGMGRLADGYCARELERRRLLLLAQAEPKQVEAVCRFLPALDEELLLRARAALAQGLLDRAEHLLEAAEDRQAAGWLHLRGQLWLARKDYPRAAKCFHGCEAVYPRECSAGLERCYREMGNFERAYFYAVRQRGTGHGTEE